MFGSLTLHPKEAKMANKKENKEIDKSEQQKTETITIPTAQRHKVLDDIAEQVDSSSEVSDVFTIAGHKYKLQTLKADEEVWADGYTNTSSAISTFTSMKIPKLAAALKEIDGVAIRELFDFSKDAPKADVEYHNGSQYRRRYWEMNQMLVWLGDRPDNFIKELWDGYYSLLNRREKSWDELKKSLAGMPGGDSRAMSSPEKASSPATQTSRE
jgi:hypothetical protein